MKKRFGFTLAEVLITLSIIGVIAAMTVPTLMSSTSEQEYKTGLKKAISTINQAITMQYALEGTTLADYYVNSSTSGANGRATLAATGAPTTDTMSGPMWHPSEGIIGAVFNQRMQVVNATMDRPHDPKNPTVKSGNAAIYLPDGMAIEFPPGGNTAAKACQRTDGCMGMILVDVNGDKGKCTVANATALDGKKQVHPSDCFPLVVTPDGVRPGNFVAEQIMYNGK